MVRELAALAGVPFPERRLTAEEQARIRQWEVRRAVLNLVIRQAQAHLWTSAGEAARAYLIETRGFTAPALQALGFGLYPDVSLLRRLLQAPGYAAADLQALSGVWEGLSGYIIIPWHDEAGRPLTLYGRWPGDPPPGRPKTTALPGADSKRSPLYLDRTRQAGHSEVILVEGVLDAALAQSLGDTRVIACVAAQLSRRQVQTLARHHIQGVTICLDPDTGGDSGTLSCIKSLRAAQIRAYVAPRLPDGLDPDEFLLRHGLAAWQAHLAGARKGVLWQAERLLAPHDVTTDKGRDTAIAALVALHKGLTDPVEQQDLERLLAERIGYVLRRPRRIPMPAADPWWGPRNTWHGLPPIAPRRLS
jgi:putative DNA primase/helicase